MNEDMSSDFPVVKTSAQAITKTALIIAAARTEMQSAAVPIAKPAVKISGKPKGKTTTPHTIRLMWSCVMVLLLFEPRLDELVKGPCPTRWPPSIDTFAKPTAK
jgi:hypothetical protein